MPNGAPPVTAGATLRRLRARSGKSLTVVAGLAGISASYLSRLERNERALDRRSLVVALANALEVAPAAITQGATGAAPARDTDRYIDPLRRALLEISMGEPAGQVVPLGELRRRVDAAMVAQRACDYAQVGAALPGLVRDLHTTLATGHDERELLQLLAVTGNQGVAPWISAVNGPPDLAWQAVLDARNAAERLEDPLYIGLTGFGTAFGLLGAGSFDVAARTLAQTDPGTGTPESAQVSGMIALASSLVSAAQGDHTARNAALDHAADIATTTAGNVFWMSFGPANAAMWRLSTALEVGAHAEAARIAEMIRPELLPSPTRVAAYWRDRGRALAHLPKRRGDAVVMLRRAERISPEHVLRHPATLSTISMLASRGSLRNEIGRELQGLAHRAGLL